MFTPSKKDFHKYAKQGNLIPVYCELIADSETAISIYQKITSEESATASKYSFLLESVEGGENVNRYSFIGTDPLAVIVQDSDKNKYILDKDGKKALDGDDIFETVKNYLSNFNFVHIPGIPAFSGGALGFAGYEVIEDIEASVQCAKGKAPETPDAVFMIVDTLIVIDYVHHKIQIIGHADTREVEPELAYDIAVKKIENLIEKLQKKLLVSTFSPVPKSHTLATPKSNISFERFSQMVEKAREYIYDGDIIQVVLSQRFEKKTDISAINLHRALRLVNPSPYMFCLQMDGFSLVGASPEVHAKCENRDVTVRPIAGTRPRGKTKEKDLEYEKELLSDSKECAEHIMLVDLARNDVGRIAKTGTVMVPELMIIERYSHVMHIVSQVTCELDSKFDSDAVMRTTFPAGTVSGAPKIRAMQIISELESCRRGPYAGAVAYFSFAGNIDSSITIRTVMLKDGLAYIQAGAGIVADSKPEFEYQETLNKASAMFKALDIAEKL